MAVKRKSTGVFGIVVSFDWAGRNLSLRQPGRHKSAKVLPRYAKRTTKQVAGGARTRRAARTNAGPRRPRRCADFPQVGCPSYHHSVDLMSPSGPPTRTSGDVRSCAAIGGIADVERL